MYPPAINYMIIKRKKKTKSKSKLKKMKNKKKRTCIVINLTIFKQNIKLKII